MKCSPFLIDNPLGRNISHERKPNMPDSVVTLTQCYDYRSKTFIEVMERQFGLPNGLGKFVRPGDSVLLKPNFIAPRSHRHATQTHPAVIIEAARILKDFGARPFVGDSPAWANVSACAQALRLDEPLKKLGVPIIQLDKPKWVRIGAGRTKIGISSAALDADVIINLPKFKSHQQLAATFAVKNMFGCVTGKHKAFWHFAKGRNPENFYQMLIDIYRYLSPALTIIDGVYAMDGPGPINGRTRPLGWIIGGTDPIACETICAKLINIDPQNVPIIKTAETIGFGCCDPAKIKITGDQFPKDVCTDFEMPKMIPIRFSLPHVCRSICKQIILLTKATYKKLFSK